MVAAGLTVSLQQILLVRLQKNDFEAVTIGFEGREYAGMLCDETFFPGVHDEGQASDIGIVPQGKFQELWQQGNGHVVDTVETGVFHHVDGRALTRPRKAGNNENMFSSHVN
jgi:hypothetical protein